MIDNFIHLDLPASDIKLFFGENEKVDWFSDSNTLAHIVCRLNKFPSFTQARKNGWDRPIPPGFAEHKIGKTKFWTLNKWPGWSEAHEDEKS